ncbi:Hypothetical predicted protein [Cloeon dipterum]|uniref:Caspase family p20 domain-containing protein n=1 Tax=Cloeon dipterum TaxID=197152 RepID=A0A8S1DMI0_9INSE|nr:Hypothetical predicted protein [Cloeon dipterum]
MLDEDRQTINKNLDKLVKHTSDIGLERIIEILKEMEVLSDEFAKPYLDTKIKANMRKVEFYLNIQRLGPAMFEKLKHAVSVCKYEDLLFILQPYKHHLHPIDERLGARPTNLPDYMNEVIPTKMYTTMDQYQDASVNFSMQAIDVKVREADQRLDLKKSKSPRYRCGSSPKGLALIINIREYQDKSHSTRKGSEHDDKNLEELFKQLGYQTEVHLDLDKREFMDVIKMFAANPKHFQVHTCMVAIMCHGQMEKNDDEDSVTTVFITTDGKTIPYTWVVHQFDAVNCRGLINKPKVFFFQACRGESKATVQRLGYGLMADHTEADGMGNLPIPVRKLSDVLIAHAAPRGYIAMRDVNKGSWFIQKIVEVFMNKAHNTHVLSMLQEVDVVLSRSITSDCLSQTVCIEQFGFNHKLYLSPGLYD